MAAKTLIDIYRIAVETCPDTALFGYKAPGDQTWTEVAGKPFFERAQAISQGLVSLGIQPGDRVALLSSTRYEWALADAAILGAAAASVPVYPTLLAEQIAYIVNDSQPRAIFCENAEQVAKIEQVRDQIPSIEHVIVFDPVDRASVMTLEHMAKLGKVRLDENPSAFDERANQLGPEDLATLIYTSGTTGDPKGVMLTHDNFVHNVYSTLSVLEIRREDRALSFLPLSHVFERTGLYFLLSCGVTIYYAESALKVVDNMQEVHPTIVISVPRLYEKIYTKVLGAVENAGGLRKKIFFWAKDLGVRRARLIVEKKNVPWTLELRYKLADKLIFSKIRAATGNKIRYFISGGAPLDIELGEFFYAAGLPILVGYGLTETSPVITASSLERMRFGSAGYVLPSVQVRIADDGEILTKSRSVMRGYYNKPEATAEVLKDGWFATGDIGHLDDDGFLFITDRKKDLIVTAGGKNIAPQPTEGKIKNSPLVSEAALIGDQRKYVVALIVPSFNELEQKARSEGITYTDRAELCSNPQVRKWYQAIVNAVNANLPRYEQIKDFALLENEFTIDSGELTPTLKIKRRVVQQKYADKIEALYT